MPRVEQPFGVDGYVVTDLIGFGATGEVWRGRDETTHEPVALKRLWEPASDGLVLRLREDAAVVSEIAGPHAVRLLEVAILPGGEVVLVMAEAAGGSLGGLLARRGRLHPSEVVTLLGPLAQVLAELHRRGMIHGDLTPNNVLLAANGCPMLADTALAIATGEQPGGDVGYRDPAHDNATPPTAASDCFGLAALGYAALTGVAPRNASGVIEPIVGRAPWVPASLASAIEAGLAADPALRPDIASFGAAVLAACGAAPLRLTGPRRTTEADETTASESLLARGPRRTAVAVFVVAVLVISALVGVTSARFNPPRASALQPAPTTDVELATTTPRWKDPTPYRPIVANLFALRARAFKTGRLALLDSVYTPESSVHDMDAAALRVLRSQHLHTRGFVQRILRISIHDVSPGYVELTLTTTIPSYVVVDRDGHVVAERHGRTQHFEMSIERRHREWLIQTLGQSPRVAPQP